MLTTPPPDCTSTSLPEFSDCRNEHGGQRYSSSPGYLQSESHNRGRCMPRAHVHALRKIRDAGAAIDGAGADAEHSGAWLAVVNP